MTQHVLCARSRRALRQALGDMQSAYGTIDRASKRRAIRRAMRRKRPFWPDSVTGLLWLFNGFGLGLFLLSIWFATH